MTEVNEAVVETATNDVIAAIENTESVIKTKLKPGRKALLDDEKNIVRILTSIFVNDAEEIPSRPILIKLVERGLLETYDIKSGVRGRPAKGYQLTSEGKTMIGESIEEQEQVEPQTNMEETETEAENNVGELVTE